MVLLVLLAMVISIFWRFKKEQFSQKDVLFIFFTMLIAYTFVSYAVTGIFGGEMYWNHHLYVLNILLIFVLFRSKNLQFNYTEMDRVDLKKWLFFFLVVLGVLAILALIAISVHGDLGDRDRFPMN
jgi:phosphoglycerol transferase MdoB-like AlkP superfamily enzyme